MSMATQARETAPVPTDQGGVQRASPYAYYALALLILANMFNYIDRNIVSALAPAIKADLKLDDADMGFLLGTAFAVLYGVLGISMGRIADALSRPRLMAGGLALWSMMTAMSGGAMSFAQLGATRVGVGVGEATANPVSQSMLSDFFPARNRGAVLGGYLASVHLGHAIALIVGGLFVTNWGSMCLAFPNGACRLANWRAAFLVVGLPGLLLAIAILFLREPPRPTAYIAKPAMQIIKQELSSAIPPLTIFALYELGGKRALQSNILLIAALAVASTGVAVLTGDWAQWIAVAIGVYSVATWSQILKHGDTPLFKLTFGCPTFMLMMFGGALLACFVGTIATWAMPYAVRTFGGNSGTIGLALGAAQFGSAMTSVIVGGVISDWWKKRDRRAPIWIGMIALLVPVPLLFVLLSATTLGGFIAAYSAITLFSMSWAGPFAAEAIGLVLVRMRATTSAIFSLVMILTAAGIGPYWVGKVSTMSGSLTMGLYSLLAFVPAAAVLLMLAARRLRHETPEKRSARARRAGEFDEPVPV
jgi:MFS family permease